MKRNIKDIIIYLIKSILAEIMIAIGGTIYLSLDNKTIGSIFFAIGLFMICTRGLNLFTGKIGYIFENNLKYTLEVIITLIGNFIGTFTSAYTLKYTRIYSSISFKAESICNIKLNDTLLSIFILSIFCGILMYLAVNGYKEIKDSGKYLSIFLCVIVFILCSFEHSIANMYYFSIANLWSSNTFLYLFIMILGNSIEGVFIPLSNKLNNKLNN